MAISINQISNGIGLLINNEVHLVTEYQHVKPGKGAAFVRVKLKNVRTGLVVEKTFRPSEKLESVDLEEREFEFLYQAGEDLHFMDHTTYEEAVVSAQVVGDSDIKFLKDNLTVSAICHDTEVMKIVLPIFITFEITHTEPGFKGDSTRAGTKPATIETGTSVQVPLFVEIGDVVKIDTRTGQYVERVQK